MDYGVKNGQRFGTWLVLEVGTPKSNCACDCGVTRFVATRNLYRGISKNCGCQRKHRVIHGASPRSGKTKTYRQWKAMRARCQPNSQDKRNYAERGINVCKRWEDFSAFLADMGDCPTGLTLDRIDNDKGYSPDNCRWADMKTQRINQRRVTWLQLDGETMHVQDAAAAIGVHASAVWNDKRRNGGTTQDALDRVAARNR